MYSSTASVAMKPGTSTTSSRPSSATRRTTSGRSGPSPTIAARSCGSRARASTSAGRIAGTCFSGMWRPANSTSGSGDARRAGGGRPVVLPLEHDRLAVVALGDQPAGVQAREAERPLRAPGRRQVGRAIRRARRPGRGTRASSRGSRPRASPRTAGSASAPAQPPPPAARSTGTTPCGPRRSAGRDATGATARRRRTRSAGGCAGGRGRRTAPSGVRRRARSHRGRRGRRPDPTGARSDS